MTKNIEGNLHASNWRFATKILGNEAYKGFRCMQIDAFTAQKTLEANGVSVSSFDYFIDRKSVYFEIAIPNESVENFYKKARFLWNYLREDLPLHRNDYWIEEIKKPQVSVFYLDVANGNLILQIKTNPKSKRYIYCTPDELAKSDELTLRHSLRYYEEFLK